MKSTLQIFAGFLNIAIALHFVFAILPKTTIFGQAALNARVIEGRGRSQQ